LEEAKVIKETLKRQLEEKKEIKENLEAKMVSLRKELQKKDIQLNFGNSTKILDEIIYNKKPFYDKYGLGHCWCQKPLLDFLQEQSPTPISFYVTICLKG
jgi:hypothetical protein